MSNGIEESFWNLYDSGISAQMACIELGKKFDTIRKKDWYILGMEKRKPVKEAIRLITSITKEVERENGKKRRSFYR